MIKQQLTDLIFRFETAVEDNNSKAASAIRKEMIPLFTEGLKDDKAGKKLLEEFKNVNLISTKVKVNQAIKGLPMQMFEILYD